jgi:hypothetical protein
MAEDAEMRRRLEALEQAHRELEDSFIVMTHLETRMSQVVRQQSEAIATNSSRLDRAEILISEMTEKVHFLIDREMRREGGPESRP